jgi:sec-independent protein translocase protein TatA
MGISLWKLLVILAVVALVFGTTRLRNLGADLAAMIKGLRGALREDEPPADAAQPASPIRQIGSKQGADKTAV